jgi:phosphatidylinositol 3-kinase
MTSFCRLKQETQAHLTICVGDTENPDDIIMGLAGKQSIVFCSTSGDGDSIPIASEDFFAFPFIEDFIDQQTPAEHKHRAMSRCARSLSATLHHSLTFLRSSVVTADRTLKPDSQVHFHGKMLTFAQHFAVLTCFQELLSIHAALNSPPSVEPTAEQRQLLWTYRFSLLNMERAMKRLLLWFDESSSSNPAENQLVKDLITEWERQVALTPYDGLPLLSQSFRNPVLRKFAVQILKKNEQGHDESMQQMLLQLVQALRYEEQINASPLAELLVKRSQRLEATAYALNWFLTAEMRTDPRNLKFQNVIGRLSQALTKQQQASLVLQNAMVDELVAIASLVKTLPAKQRVSALRDMLQKSTKFPFSKFSNLVPLPIDPQLKAKCLDIDKSEVYTSSQVPVGLTFILEDGSRYSTILKTGDDVRQDQLILQTICIMDGILKRYGVDMRLTPYRALAVSKTAGFVQKVPDCERLSVILSKYSGSIINFLKEQPPPSRDAGNMTEKDKPGQTRREMANKYGINAEVYYNFVYSCAGYCVITYILGIGDRHLDNILIQRNGKLFHIDFGFILGADPKPMPSPMRIVQQMVDAMGGVRGEEWATFLDLCVEMFNRLRKHADFFVSLFALMKHGGIIGIRSFSPIFAFGSVRTSDSCYAVAGMVMRRFQRRR